MRKFVEDESIPRVRARADDPSDPLRPRSISQYTTRLQHYARVVGDMRIADAVVPDTVQRHIDAIARNHGAVTASYCARAVPMYVFDVLAKMTVIQSNPISAGLITSKAPKPAEKQIPTPDEREQVIVYLLGLDPTSPGTHGHSSYVMTAKRSGVLAQPGRVTHMWRTSLNDEWRNSGIPIEWRVAYLGHTEEVNTQDYTAHIDFGNFIDMVGENTHAATNPTDA